MNVHLDVMYGTDVQYIRTHSLQDTGNIITALWPTVYEIYTVQTSIPEKLFDI